MSDAGNDIADIRRELWSLYAKLKEDEVDPDAAVSMTEVLDSLIDLVRLEGELKHGAAEPPGEAGKKGADEPVGGLSG